jgi:hypothetical protein
MVNMLVYFDPAMMCTDHLVASGLLLSPLPAEKQLWEAGDEYSWQAVSQLPRPQPQKPLLSQIQTQSRSQSSGPAEFGVTVNGNLVRVEGGNGRECLGTDSGFGEFDADLDASLNGVFHVKGEKRIVKAEWEEWCAGMDGLGGLVMLAASLVS